MTHEWHKCVHNRSTSELMKQKVGPTFNFKTNFLIAQEKDFTHVNHWLTGQEVAEDTGTSNGASNRILMEDLGMHKVSVKFVSRLFTEDQTSQCVSFCKNILQWRSFFFKLHHWRWELGLWVKYWNKTSYRYGKVLIYCAPKKEWQVRSKVKTILIISYQILQHYPSWVCSGRLINHWRCARHSLWRKLLKNVDYRTVAPPG